MCPLCLAFNKQVGIKMKSLLRLTIPQATPTPSSPPKTCSNGIRYNDYHRHLW